MKLPAIIALIWLSACSQHPDENSANTQKEVEPGILVRISPADEPWFGEGVPDQLRGEIPIDEQSGSPVHATIDIDPDAIPVVEPLPGLPAATVLPVFCGGRIEAGLISESSCFLKTLTSSDWIEVDGGISLEEGQESVTGRALCMSFVGSHSHSNTVCQRYDYR